MNDFVRACACIICAIVTCLGFNCSNRFNDPAAWQFAAMFTVIVMTVVMYVSFRK